jgi:hypothetical protein
VIVTVGFVAYWNALDIGFWTDDYSFLETAGRLGWQDYLASYFDPRLQWHWYRPMQGLEWWIGYALFRTVPTGYHFVQILLHLVNTLLLFGLTTRVTRRWRVGLLAALMYVTLPAQSLAVYWPGVADPLATLFFLLAIWGWLDYLEIGGRGRFALAYAAFIGALFSKEIGAVLPLTLFLADRWLVARTAALNQLVKRYALFCLALLVYGLFELNVLTRGVFTQHLGYGVGGHIFPTLIHHLTALAFPWGLEPPLSYAWLLGVLALFAYAAYRRAWHALFLGAAMALAVLPILPFPSSIASAPRYLYLPLMGSMIGFGSLVDKALMAIRNLRWRWILAGALSLGVTLLLMWHAAVVADGAVSFAGTARAERLRFRPIFQRHPSFAPGTLLYFIAPTYPNLSGLMFTRYGTDVTTEGTDTGHLVRLREYSAAIVFYCDDQNNWHEQVVDPNLNVRTVLVLPASFAEPIVLEAFDLASDKVKRGDAVALILYWRATAKVGKDYTVFVHLVDATGKMVTGADTLLLQGDRPTSRWRVGELTPDGIIVPIDATIPPGDYKIEIGLYDPAIMQRLAIVDANGQSITDKVMIGPIGIIE